MSTPAGEPMPDSAEAFAAAVRPAVRADYNAVAALNREVQQLHVDAHPQLFKPDASGGFSAEVFEGMLERPGGHLLVVVEDGKVAGYLYAYDVQRPETWATFARPHMYIDQIAVAAVSQRHGLGSRLMDAVLERARLVGIERVELDTWWFNSRARSFFARHGFGEQIVRFAKRVPEQLRR